MHDLQHRCRSGRPLLPPLRETGQSNLGTVRDGSSWQRCRTAPKVVETVCVVLPLAVLYATLVIIGISTYRDAKATIEGAKNEVLNQRANAQNAVLSMVDSIRQQYSAALQNLIEQLEKDNKLTAEQASTLTQMVPTPVAVVTVVYDDGTPKQNIDEVEATLEAAGFRATPDTAGKDYSNQRHPAVLIEFRTIQ